MALGCRVMHSETQPSDALVELVFDAFDHAFGSIASGGTLAPFAILESGDGRQLARFVAPTFEEGVERGREHLRGLDPKPDRVVLALDGYARDGETRTDAIFIEAQDRGGPGFTFLMRYRPAKGLLRRKPRPLDTRPVLAGGGPRFL